MNPEVHSTCLSFALSLFLPRQSAFQHCVAISHAMRAGLTQIVVLQPTRVLVHDFCNSSESNKPPGELHVSELLCLVVALC